MVMSISHDSSAEIAFPPSQNPTFRWVVSLFRFMAQNQTPNQLPSIVYQGFCGTSAFVSTGFAHVLPQKLAARWH